MINLKYIVLSQKHMVLIQLYAGVKLGNSPVNFKTCDNINVFKRCLDNWKCVNDKCAKCHEFLYHV